MHVPVGSHLEFLHLCKDLLAFLFFFIEWSRRARKVVASERSRINSNGLLGAHVPFGSGLQLLHLFQDTIAFLGINFFVVFVLFSRRTGKKVSSAGSRIDSHGLLWAHVPLGGSLELLHLFQDEFAFLFFLIDGGRRAREVVASACGSINSNGLLGAHVPLCDSLELLHLFQDALTFLLVLLLGSRRTSKVVASKSRGIRGCNGLFGRQIPLGNFLEVLGIGQDLFALLFVIGNGSRVTRKEATGLSTHRTGYGSFGMIVILGNLAELAGFLQDLATFGQVFYRSMGECWKEQETQKRKW